MFQLVTDFARNDHQRCSLSLKLIFVIVLNVQSRTLIGCYKPNLCYYIFDNVKLSMEAAVKHCKENGMSIAKLSMMDHISFANDDWTLSHKGYIWIGGRRHHLSGWTWTDGELVGDIAFATESEDASVVTVRVRNDNQLTYAAYSYFVDAPGKPYFCAHLVADVNQCYNGFNAITLSDNSIICARTGTNDVSWFSASRMCSSKSVTITRRVFDKMKQDLAKIISHNIEVWLPIQHTVWHWVGASTTDYSDRIVYEQFAANEPAPKVDCLAVMASDNRKETILWYARNCQETYPVICQDTMPLKFACQPSIQCFYLYTKSPSSFSQAQAKCGEDNKILASFNDTHVYQLIVASWPKSEYMPVWVNVRQHNLGKWLWLDGHEATDVQDITDDAVVTVLNFDLNIGDKPIIFATNHSPTYKNKPVTRFCISETEDICLHGTYFVKSKANKNYCIDIYEMAPLSWFRNLEICSGRLMTSQLFMDTDLMMKLTNIIKGPVWLPIRRTVWYWYVDSNSEPVYSEIRLGIFGHAEPKSGLDNCFVLSPILNVSEPRMELHAQACNMQNNFICQDVHSGNRESSPSNGMCIGILENSTVPCNYPTETTNEGTTLSKDGVLQEESQYYQTAIIFGVVFGIIGFSAVLAAGISWFWTKYRRRRYAESTLQDGLSIDELSHSLGTGESTSGSLKGKKPLPVEDHVSFTAVDISEMSNYTVRSDTLDTSQSTDPT